LLADTRLKNGANIIWLLTQVPVVDVNVDSAGIVESIDSEQLPKGRVLADEVECNQFQDVEASDK
jgi:hypothetical protein